MNILRKILLLPPLVNCGLGIGLIVGAYIFEIFGYYDPCPLCILQRWSFGLIALCGALLIIPGLFLGLKKALLFLASLFSMGGGVIAGRFPGKTLNWDSKKARFMENEANKYLDSPYRKF